MRKLSFCSQARQGWELLESTASVVGMLQKVSENSVEIADC
jgi:hypothetical protein